MLKVDREEVRLIWGKVETVDIIIDIPCPETTDPYSCLPVPGTWCNKMHEILENRGPTSLLLSVGNHLQCMPKHAWAPL